MQRKPGGEEKKKGRQAGRSVSIIVYSREELFDYIKNKIN